MDEGTKNLYKIFKTLFTGLAVKINLTFYLTVNFFLLRVLVII